MQKLKFNGIRGMVANLNASNLNGVQVAARCSCLILYYRGSRGTGQQKPLTDLKVEGRDRVDGFNYEEMVQEGLRRRCSRSSCRSTAIEGLPGAHHFYIAFKTDYPHVQLPDYLKRTPS
jgi:hypothetical protein